MTMRRIISDSECFYHICNRIAGNPHEFPFGNEEKTKFYEILKSLMILHKPSIRVISHCFLDNHFHIILSHNPNAKITKATAQHCFHKYYESLGKESTWNDENYQQVTQRMTSLASFVGQLQKRFSGWMNHVSRVLKYNCVYRGHLWAERYQSSALLTSESLRNCIVYIAFNPLRAGLVNDIGKYRFSSWGEYQQTGKHPHAENFAKYFLHDRDNAKSDDFKLKEALLYMQQLVDERITNECSLTEEEKDKAWNNSINRIGIFKIVTRRVSHWSQGKIIGTKLKSMELAANYYDNEKLAKRKFKVFKDGTEESDISVFQNTIRNPKAQPS